MSKKKFAEIKISKGLRLVFYPECGHIVIYKGDEIVETGSAVDCKFVEVSVYEEIEDEKR